MKKRVIAFLLVFSLAIFSLNALQTFPLKGQTTSTEKKTSVDKKKSNLQFGIQLGGGFDNTNVKLSYAGTKLKGKIKEGGFYLAATMEHKLKPSFVIKTELGFLTMGKATFVTYNNGAKNTEKDEDKTPANLNIYVGGEYIFDFKTVKLGVGGGLDLMSGKQSSDLNDKPNGRIGIGLEVVGKMAITKGLTVTAGLKGVLYFLNSGSYSDSYIPALFYDIRTIAKENNGKSSHSQFGMKFFVGCIFTN